MSAIFESLKGKKVLITGSSRGIGRALAIGFAKSGADVALHGVKPGAAMDEALSLVSSYGVKAVAVYGDLGDESIPQTIVNDAAKLLGRVDILICNASVQIRRPWLEITDEDMLVQTKTNFFSAVKLMQAVVPGMLEHGWGRIITNGSIQQDKPHPDMLIYSAIKSAVHNVVKSLATQLADKNITVNNVPVGTIYTDRNTEVLKNEEYHQKVKSDIPVGFIGVPDDCVAGVLLLASEEGRYITGENIHIDGGKFL